MGEIMVTTSLAGQVGRRFNEIYWHDSVVRSLSVNYSPLDLGPELSYEIVLRAGMMTSRINPKEEEAFEPVEVRFEQARYFRADLDLLGMHVCGGSISYAECFAESDFKRQLFQTKIANTNAPQFENYWANLSHFLIYLCDPSGEINIIAKDFKL